MIKCILVCLMLLQLASCDKARQTARYNLDAERLVTPPNVPNDLFRTRIPNGWLVWSTDGMVVVNDPEYTWSLK